MIIQNRLLVYSKDLIHFQTIFPSIYVNRKKVIKEAQVSENTMCRLPLEG